MVVEWYEGGRLTSRLNFIWMQGYLAGKWQDSRSLGLVSRCSTAHFYHIDFLFSASRNTSRRGGSKVGSDSLRHYVGYLPPSSIYPGSHPKSQLLSKGYKAQKQFVSKANASSIELYHSSVRHLPPPFSHRSITHSPPFSLLTAHPLTAKHRTTHAITNALNPIVTVKTVIASNPTPSTAFTLSRAENMNINPPAVKQKLAMSSLGGRAG